MTATTTPLPSPILVGPILRRVTAEQCVIWLISTAPVPLAVTLLQDDQCLFERPLREDEVWSLALGEHAWMRLVNLHFDTPLPCERPIAYDLAYHDSADWVSLRQWGAELLYPGEALPTFVIRPQLHSLLHGSCRKPHYPGPDGLARADRWLAQRHEEPTQRPSLLMLSGDQLYADDVAGPLLLACHRLAERLGLWCEELPGAVVDDSAGLLDSSYCYYRREQLLPHDKRSEAVRKRFFGGVRKPIFTSDAAHNHLITYAEVIAAYCLVWSADAWHGLDLTPPGRLNAAERLQFDQELEQLQQFRAQLPAVRRLLAHLPTYMIFDDHDVTDDWNLSAAWEEAAYNHPFSRRIIGNTLIGYLLCQGLGNTPDRLRQQLGGALEHWLEQRTTAQQDALIEQLFHYQRWDYTVPLQPGVVVLDTRTRRWRSEQDLAHPSGLLDWEALSDLQQQLIGRDAVVLVSPAPIFGVKLIEAIQKLFTLAGQPLMVDAENWMAHRGSANVMLNIFSHRQTPQQFVILSGDVHYSFVYDVELRFRRHGPQICQITASGLKNQFPPRLLTLFDHINRWLYAPRSPLNWFTKRRRMRVTPRRPQPHPDGQRLVNRCGIGLVYFAADGAPEEVWLLGADDQDVRFDPGNGEEHWG